MQNRMPKTCGSVCRGRNEREIAAELQLWADVLRLEMASASAEPAARK